MNWVVAKYGYIFCRGGKWSEFPREYETGDTTKTAAIVPFDAVVFPSEESAAECAKMNGGRATATRLAVIEVS